MNYRRCSLCSATVQEKELQGEQKLCEVCRLFMAREIKEDTVIADNMRSYWANLNAGSAK